MEDLVHDLPLPVDFEQREQVREPTTGPVIEFKPHGGDRVNEVDVGDPCLELLRYPETSSPENGNAVGPQAKACGSDGASQNRAVGFSPRAQSVSGGKLADLLLKPLHEGHFFIMGQE